MSEETPVEYLRQLGSAGDGPHDIATAALMFGALDHPERELAPYREHLAELGEAARAEAEFARDAERAAEALAAVLAGRYGYDGDQARYDEPDAANLISVIDRRRGLPVALGILYMHAARAAGLKARGLSAPGRFLMTVESRGGEVIVDPFNGGTVVDLERLSAPPMLSEPGLSAGADALEPVSDIEVLLRLQNNVMARAMQNFDTQRTAEIMQRMLLIAPDRAALWFELGRIQESAGALGAARESYERAVALAKARGGTATEAGLALQTLKRRLN